MTTYTVYGSGDVVVDGRLSPARVRCPSCRGSACRWPSRLRCPRDVARPRPARELLGPRDGAAVGLYSGAVADLVHDYVRPQEIANRTDVRWVALTDAGPARAYSPRACPS